MTPFYDVDDTLVRQKISRTISLAAKGEERHKFIKEYACD